LGIQIGRRLVDSMRVERRNRTYPLFSVETALGILSYTELEPHLARRVQAVEEQIDAGELSWRVSIQTLLERIGPFRPTNLEAPLRAGDWCASRREKL
jgi:hypothetical protein